MKKCSDCNIEMIEGLDIRSDEPSSIDNKDRLYIVTNQNDYYGTRVSEDNAVKCRICPNCGKIELYINPEDIK